MRLPRDVSGSDLAKALRALGYTPTRQAGSHLRLTTFVGGEHHVTVPVHKTLRLGTLASIVDEVAKHLAVSRADVVEKLFANH